MGEFLLKFQQISYQLLYIVVFFFSFSLAYLARIVLILFLHEPPAIQSITTNNIIRSNEITKSLSQYEDTITGNFIRGSSPTSLDSSSREIAPTGGENMVVTGILSGHWSFARVTILEPGETDATEYAIGNTVKGYKIKEIYPHYVIFYRDKIKYKVGIGETPGQNSQKSSPDSASIGSGETIKKILSRTDLNAKLQDPTAIYKDARFGPNLVNGKIDGYKIFHVPENHMFYSLGAKSGDIIKRVNGMPLSETEKMLEIWNSVKTADRITIDIERQGKIITYEFVVQN